jgi:hypothetical protein
MEARADETSATAATTVPAGGANTTDVAGREPEGPGAPALPPAAKGRIPAGLPQWQRRMLLSGFGYLYAPDGSFIETANEAFARMAVLATLRKYPEIMDSDDTAEDLFHLLDPEAQTRLAAEANVAPAKVVGKEIASSLLVSTGMIQATLKVSKQGALNLVGELNLREITGRGQFRAWVIV